jgi:hypothetical protein
MTTLLLALAFALLLQVTESPSKTAAVWLAGLAVPFVTHLIKRYACADGFLAFVLTIAISLLFAIGVCVYTGEIHSFSDVAKNSATVLATATITFKTLREAGVLKTDAPAKGEDKKS